MSTASIAPEIPAGCYSYTFSALGAGGIVSSSNVQATYLASSVVNYFPGVSQIVGCVRTTAGGTVGQPICGGKIEANSTTTGYVSFLELASQSLLDTSVYTVFWTNKIADSDVKAILPC
jgi:hypothetical protein